MEPVHGNGSTRSTKHRSTLTARSSTRTIIWDHRAARWTTASLPAPTWRTRRCMFESNFAVDRLSLSYTVCWNAMQKLAGQYGDAGQDAMFSGTARRIYRLAD